MAGCLYAVNGKWLTESQFKKILNDGLLDQLIVNQQFKMPEAFKPDPEIIAKHSGEIEAGPVKLKVVRKINSNKMINNQVDINKAEEGQTLGYTTRPSRRSPRTVIEESNKQIEQENKRLGLTRSPNRMWFVTKVGGKIQYGGLNKALIKEMTANKATNLEEKLEEGIVYMLVPSAKGLYPMRMRTSFFGETKKASEGKKIIRELYQLDGKEFTARKKDLTKYLYKTNFKKKKDGSVEVQAERAGGQVEKFTFATPEEMINYVVGDYTNGQVNLTPEGKPGSRGLIAKVDHLKLNKKTKSPEALGNIFYADQGFVTTDLYTEGGNFFSNSSFIIEAYQATGKDLEVLQAVMEGDMPATTEEAEAEAVENQVTTPAVPNEKTKKDEAPINDRTMQEVNEMRIITLPIENSNQVYRIYVEPKGNTLEMTKIQIGTLKKVKNANDVFQPTRELTGTEASTVRNLAKEKFDTLKKEFNARNEVEPEGGVFQDPPSPADVGSGLFDFPIIPEEGMIEDENTPTKPNYGFGDQTGGENLDLNPRTRTTSKKVDATKMTAVEQRDQIRKTLGTNALEGHFSIFNTLEDLEKYLPEETYQILLEARKNGEYLHGIFTEAAVHLSENAAEGTGFHEAFHVVFRLGLNLEQRLALLEEVIDLYPDQTTPSSTLIDLEEILADEYMDYALSDEALKLPPSSHIARWFKGIYRTINVFYGRNPKVSVHRIFEDMQLGVYRNRLTFENTDFSKISPEAVRLKTEKPVYVDPKFEEEIFQFVEYKMFQLIDKAREAMHSKERPTRHLSDSEMINLITQKHGIRSLYGMVLFNISTDMNTNAADGKNVAGLEQVLKYFTDEMKAVEMMEVGGKNVPIYSGKPPAIVERFNRYLRHREININIDAIEDFSPALEEGTSFDENLEEGTAEERWQKAYIEINPQTTLSQTVRRRMGTIPKLVNVDGEQQPVRNSLGAPITYSEAEVFGYLGQKITDSYSPTDMVQKLMDLRDDKPFVNQILNFIEKDVNFKTSLYTTLASKTFQKFLMIYEEKGNYTWFYSNRKTVDNLIKENLIADFIVEDNELFEKHGDAHTLKGQRNYNKPKLSKVSEEIVKLGKLRERAQKTTKPEELRKIVKDFSDFLTSNNIFVTSQQLTDIWNPSKEFSQTKWDNIIGVMNKANAVFMQLANGHNPFLVLRPDSEDGFKAPLQEFVEALKPGMEKEVIAAFRNGDNKTVYAIQYSNHLTKMMQILKDPEKFKQYLEENKKDPVLMSMPMIQEIRDGEMDPEELEVVLFDSLARKGKNKSVPYSELSDIEMEAMAMAAFHKSGSAKYGYYKMPTPSDGSILPLIKGKKLGYEEVLDNLLTVALGEVKRMREWELLPQNSQLRLIANYKDNATSFQILSFLNGKVDMNSPSLDMDIKAAIDEYLQNDFLELHKAQWKRAGIILDYEAGPNGNIKFADNVITKSKQGKEVEFFKEYLYNQYYMNTQMTTIFAGDPAYYKNTVDYQKRYKQIISPGMLTNSELVDEEYHGIVFNDEEVPSAPEVIQDMVKLIEKSNLPAAKKKELKARVASQLHNVTDAATFISLDRAIAKLVSMGRFTPQHQAAAERIRDGVERSSDAALFQVDKPFMFTKVNVDGRQVPVQLKNSEVLLTKSFAERKDANGDFLYPKLVEVYRMLNEAKEDEPYLSFVAFESAVKVGAPGTSIDEKGRVRYNELVEGIDGSYSLNDTPTILTFKHEDWRLQQETPEHYIDEAGNFGSQIRHLIVGDMDMNGVYMINGKPYRGSEVARMYQELIVENIKESYENVRSMFEKEDGTINYERIVSHLKEEMKRRNLDEEYFKAIELIDAVGREGKTTALPLWHPLISYKVESLLNSFFKNTITKQKIKGGNMVNATSYGVSHTLEMYMDENGNYQMEALLPWWSRKFFPKNEEGEIDVEAIPPILSKLIGYRIPTEDKYSMFNIKVVGFTDPAAGGTIILPVEATTQAGLDFDIDKLFMIVPEWRRVRDAKTGETKIEYRNYITQDSTPSEVTSAIFDSQTRFEDFVDKYVPKEHKTRILNAKETADEEIFLAIKARGQFRSQTDFNKAVQERKRLKGLLKKETNASVRRGIKQELDRTFELGKELDTFDGGVEIAYNSYNELKEEIEGFVKDHVDPANYEAEFNSTATRNNRILEIMRGIMENENTALSIMDGGNFDHLKELGNKTRLLQIPANAPEASLKLKREAKKALKQFREGKLSVEDYRKKLNELTEQLDNVDFNINLPATQLTLFRRNMTGKQLIGVFANHNTHHAKAQHTNLKLKNPITLAGKSYEMLNKIYDETGYRISKSLAIKLAAVVDNAKDPISSHLNMNSYTAHLIAMLSRLGVSEDTIFAFVNQPVIIEITNKYFNERGSLSEQKEMVSAIARDWQNKMAQEKIDLDELQEEGMDTSLEEMEDALDRNGSKAYHKTQYKVLQKFMELEPIAEELRRGVSASRVDTQGVGPSFAENYVMMDKQQRLLNQPKEDSHIENMSEMFFADSRQLINPAFNEFAWIKPITVMTSSLLLKERTDLQLRKPVTLMLLSWAT
jgi:hypothetical protein